MQLELVRAYKSIKQLPDIEINDFVVLTGVNGAGKTQFLECLQRKFIKIKDIESTDQNEVRLFDGKNLVPNNSQKISSHQIDQERESVWQAFKSCQNNLNNELLKRLSNVSIIVDDVSPFINDINYLEEKLESGIGKDKNKNINRIIDPTKTILMNSRETLIRNFCQKKPERQILIARMEEQINKHPLLWLEKEFAAHYIDVNSSISIFQQSLSRLFVAYRKASCENEINQFLVERKGKNVPFLSKNDFEKIYGKEPWKVLNNIFKIVDFDFRISIPDEDQKISYQAFLQDIQRNVEVDFNDLSSGEKIIISFVLCLYQSEDRRNIVQYPKLLLFDEIDASLHPSMTKMMLKIIREILVDKLGIKVILTTHSPSTVALAPEDTLYVMNKNSEPRIEKVNKDKALLILTAGIPTLSIDPDNRRQVLVESQHDVYHYEKIHLKLKSQLNFPERSIHFISSGDAGKGNKNQVEKLTTALTKAGNKNIYGVIDWDLKSKETDRVKVLGLGSRYNIENFILDPLALAALLFRDRFVNRDYLGLMQDQNHFDFKKLDSQKLQEISNIICAEIKEYLLQTSNKKSLEELEIEQSIDTKETKKCKYVGGFTLDLPVWFLHINGHHIEEKIIKGVYPKLNKYHRDNQLKKAITDTVYDDLPDLIPYEFVELFQKLQS
ncbi:MAG: AAA family ATPase [Limnothrix sp.]